MVVKKNAEKEKKTVQIKATTGAWWKSTTTSNVPLDNLEVPQPKIEVETVTKAIETVEKQKVAPKKRTRKKSTKAIGPEKTAVEVVEVSQDEEKKNFSSKKPSGRRSTRKTEEVSTEKKLSKPASTEQNATVAEIEATVSQVAESPVEEKAPSKRTRGRRGRGTGKKPAVAPESEKGTESETGHVGIKEKENKQAASPSSVNEPGILVKTASTRQIEPVVEIEAILSQVEEQPLEEKAPSKRSRGRRGRGTGKKPVVAPESEKGTESVAGHVGTGEIEINQDASPSFEKESGDVVAVSESRSAKAKNSRVAESQPVETKKVCKLLINAEEPEECRLALLEDGRLESIHVSTISRTQTKNNIYKARIVAIEPSLQAAFVDYGTDKNGFLPFSEIHPEYYKQDLSAETLRQVENNQWKKINITDVVEKGQEILAQVVKEEVGKKGANMTTFLSIPGRCVVLMPGSDSAGISRKISGEQRRSQLRDTMTSMDLPEGIGWIVRTASVDITQEALSRDVEYLLELWGEIKDKGQEMEGVGLVYEDHRSVLRFLREHFDPSIQEILVDDRTALEQVKEFVKMLPAEQRNVVVRYHQGARPIFNQYSVEDQIESIYQRQVNLPSGGSIVIDPTEALVAIDVNSGSTSRGQNFEASIFQANIEAATELARQLRLRDLGGLIVVDFIDMRNKKHILAVEREVKIAMKKDKAKVDFSRISKFGLMQISRQKLGAPIEAGNYRTCEHCKGRGTVRSVETLSLYYLRRIQTGASRKQVEVIECHFPLDVASYLLNNKRSELSELEKRYQVEITITAEVDMKPADNELLFHKTEKETNSKKQA